MDHPSQLLAPTLPVPARLPAALGVALALLSQTAPARAEEPDAGPAAQPALHLAVPSTLGPGPTGTGLPAYRLELASITPLPQLGAWQTTGVMDAYIGAKPPSTGLGELITGWILVGVGALNLATMPICSTDIIDPSNEKACYIASGIAGGVLLGVGIPLVVIGIKKHKKYKSWEATHSWIEHLDRTAVIQIEGGAAFRYGFQF